MEPELDTSDRFLTFRVDTQLYALSADDVTEVIVQPTLARIPQAPMALLGVANMRGSVVPVVGLRELLHKPAAGRSVHTRVIVLDVGAPVAIVVDSVEALETAHPQSIDVGKNELTAEDAEKLLGIFTVDEGRTAAKILDIRTLLESAFANRGRQKSAATHGASPVKAEGAAPGNEASTQALVTFDVAGQEFGLMLEAVQEIISLPPTMTAIARAEAVVMGVIAVRDALLPLLSLRGLLGFTATQSTGDRQKVVVMQVGGVPVGLVADRARAVVHADAGLIDPLPTVLAARNSAESRIKAIYRGDAGRRLISILSPEQLFREDVMQKLLANHKSDNARALPGNSSRNTELVFLVFRLGSDEFGLPVDTVVEVAQVPEQITRVPKTPKFLEGVINLRGDVLPVVDQRRRFDMPKLETGATRRLVVIQTERHRAGLIVDSVADVLRVGADAIEPPPDLTDATSRLLRGVINLEKSQRLVLVLDPAEVLTRAEQGLLDTFKAAGKKSVA